MSFLDDKKWARSPEHKPFREALFRRMFPHYLKHYEVQDAPDTRSTGIDYDVILTTGHTKMVQEKLRQAAYKDFLCEVWSQHYGEGDPRNDVGWTLARHDASVLTYVFVPTGVAHVMDYQRLQRTARANAEAWRDEYGYLPPPQGNPYVTLNIAVPWDRLACDMGRTEPIRTYPWVLP